MKANALRLVNMPPWLRRPTPEQIELLAQALAVIAHNAAVSAHAGPAPSVYQPREESEADSYWASLTEVAREEFREGAEFAFAHMAVWQGAQMQLIEPRETAQ